MHGLIVQPNDGVRPYNAETVTDPTIEKAIDFESFGSRYQVKMKIPLYMWNALDSEAWDRAVKLVRERQEGIRLAAAREGKILPHQWAENMEVFARKCVYNEFMKKQVQRGNGEGHAVPLDFRV
jgi:hypothetical protein